jgi:hypothetical protein
MRTEKLRDSLFIKYKHPEFVGKSIFWSKLFHTLGKPPVILDEGKTASSAEKMRQFLVFKGYWDARVDYATKKTLLLKKHKIFIKLLIKTLLLSKIILIKFLMITLGLCTKII